MIYILLIISFILLIIGAFKGTDRYGDPNGFTIGGIVLTICSTIGLCACLGTYSFHKNTIDSRLAVLEEQNEIILTQVEPVVQKALDFESNTYKELKVNPENIITISQIYPDLKDNSFIQTQLNVILTNQQQITQLKLNKATLNAFHFWIWSKRI